MEYGCLSTSLYELAEKLTSSSVLEFAAQEGVRSKLKIWVKAFKMIGAVLNDAEQKQWVEKLVKMWLDELQDLFYDVEDIVDECVTDALARKLELEQHQASTSRSRKLVLACGMSCAPTALRSNFSMHSEIDGITSRLQDFCKKVTELGLVEIAEGDDDNNDGDDDNNGGDGGKNNKKGNNDHDGDGNADKDKRGHDHGGGEMKGKNMNFMGEAMFGYGFVYHAGNENEYPIGQLRYIQEVQSSEPNSLFNRAIMIC